MENTMSDAVKEAIIALETGLAFGVSREKIQQVAKTNHKAANLMLENAPVNEVLESLKNDNTPVFKTGRTYTTKTVHTLKLRFIQGRYFLVPACNRGSNMNCGCFFTGEAVTCKRCA